MATDFATLSIRVESTGIKPAIEGINGISDAASKALSIAKGLGVALGVAAMAHAVREVAELRARFDTLGTVMKVVGNNAGYSAAQMEAYAQSLQKQGISMLESRNTLAMMASAHINLANASKLGRVAQDAAVIGNINSSEAFQRMIYGIQSGQVEILRTIGLNVNFEASYKKLAQQLGKNVASLTETEKVQARVNVVMERGADIAGSYEESMGTVGKAAKSLERIWENLRVLAGGIFQEGFIVIVDGLTRAFQTAADWVNQYGTEIGQLGTAMADVIRQSVEFGKMLSDLGGGSKGAADGVGALTHVFRGLAGIIAGTTDLIRAFAAGAAKDIGWVVEALGRVIDAVTTLGGLLGKGNIAGWGRDLQTYGNNLAAALDKQTATGGLLDKWLNDQQKLVIKTEDLARRTAILAGGPSDQAAGLMSAHSQDSKEQARIAAGIFSREEQALAAKKLQDAETHKKILEDQEKFFQKMGDDYNRALLTASELLDIELKRLRVHDSMSVAIAHQLLEATELAKLELKPHTQENLQVATISAGEMALAVAKVRTEHAKMRILVPDTWDIIGQVVVDNAHNASNAIADWGDNLDGIGRSWTTLGNTVRNVIADMLRQMERAIIKQQLMDPLMRAGLSYLPTLFGSSPSGSAASGVSGMGSGASGIGAGVGSLGGLASNVPMAAPSIVVNVSTGKGGVEAGIQGGSQAPNLAKLGEMIANTTRQIIADESRPGGMLARA